MNECEGCEGSRYERFRYHDFVYDTYYCKRYSGPWDVQMRTRICHMDECEFCKGSRFDESMDDVFYCERYPGPWDIYSVGRKCCFTNIPEPGELEKISLRNTCF